MIKSLSVSCLLAAAPLSAAAQQTETASFIIRHGADTVATEQVSRTATEINGELTLRAGKGTTEGYRAVVAPDATVALVEITVRDPAPSDRERARVAQRTRVIFRDDSVAVDDVTGHGMETRVFSTERGALPYLNLSFGLLEQAVRRAGVLGKGPLEVPFFNLGKAGSYGGQTVRAMVTRVGADSVALALGSVEFRLQVDSAGRLLRGGIPAQQLSFERTSGS